MDRIARRVAHARRNALRSAERRVKRSEMAVKVENRRHNNDAVREISLNIKAARKALRENWELGPLAPKRDLGYNNYGALTAHSRRDWSNEDMSYQQQKIAEKRCAWAGGVHRLNLAVGDRVVILEGPDKGKIDKIKTINALHGFVTLETHHQAMIVNSLHEQALPTAMPISMDSIRLVYPLTDPETGVTRDTIIRELRQVAPNMKSPNMSLERWRFGQKWDRIVPSLNVVIPWPEVKAPEYQTHPGDTPRDLVEERTFHYSLTSAPLPGGVIDELRNKYSKFRTRHEAWYVEKKEAEIVAKERRKELIKDMMTPLDEFHEMQRALRDAAGEPKLSEDMLAKIGEVMAKNKAAEPDKAEASEAAPKQ